MVLRLLEVLTNDDRTVAGVELGWNESKTYALEPLAALVFDFLLANENPVTITNTATGADVTGDVIITRGPLGDGLKITIKPNTGPWDGKATFRFRDKALGSHRVWELDPPIRNRGA